MGTGSLNYLISIQYMGSIIRARVDPLYELNRNCKMKVFYMYSIKPNLILHSIDVIE